MKLAETAPPTLAHLGSRRCQVRNELALWPVVLAQLQALCECGSRPWPPTAHHPPMAGQIFYIKATAATVSEVDAHKGAGDWLLLTTLSAALDVRRAQIEPLPAAEIARVEGEEAIMLG